MLPASGPPLRCGLIANGEACLRSPSLSCGPLLAFEFLHTAAITPPRSRRSVASWMGRATVFFRLRRPGTERRTAVRIQHEKQGNGGDSIRASRGPGLGHRISNTSGHTRTSHVNHTDLWKQRGTTTRSPCSDVAYMRCSALSVGVTTTINP